MGKTAPAVRSHRALGNLQAPDEGVRHIYLPCITTALTLDAWLWLAAKLPNLPVCATPLERPGTSLRQFGTCFSRASILASLPLATAARAT
jgi:hypothetical protein